MAWARRREVLFAAIAQSSTAPSVAPLNFEKAVLLWDEKGRGFNEEPLDHDLRRTGIFGEQRVGTLEDRQRTSTSTPLFAAIHSTDFQGPSRLSPACTDPTKLVAPTGLLLRARRYL